MTEDRTLQLKTHILRELVHTPRSYMLPEADLLAGVKLALDPPPDAAEWEEMELALELDGIIARERCDARRTSLWYITPTGRRHAKALGIK